MEYYYTEQENIDIENKLLLIKDYEYRHLVKVLRKKKDDIINITDGLRNIYISKIVNIQKESIHCEIIETKHNLNEPKIKLRLFVTPLRNMDRFEFLVEKAVELGVYEIQPVISKYTIQQTSFSKAKMERLHKIMISAMGQSQRCYLPVLHNTLTLKEMITSSETYKYKYVYYEYAENKEGIITKLDNEENICIFTGPEGGFDKSEIQQLIKNDWQVRSLGERKLRAETAAIISVFENLNNI